MQSDFLRRYRFIKYHCWNYTYVDLVIKFCISKSSILSRKYVKLKFFGVKKSIFRISIWIRSIVYLKLVQFLTMRLCPSIQSGKNCKFANSTIKIYRIVKPTCLYSQYKLRYSQFQPKLDKIYILEKHEFHSNMIHFPIIFNFGLLVVLQKCTWIT